MKINTLFIIFLISVNINSQELFIDFVNSSSPEDQISYKIVNHVFKIDTLYSHACGSRFYIKERFLAMEKNVNHLILTEYNGVGTNSYLFSVTNTGELIDKRLIVTGQDNGGPDGPDYDTFYSVEGNIITIKHRLTIPLQLKPDEKYNRQIDELRYTYIKIRKHGYIFELTEKNPNIEYRLFPYGSSGNGIPIQYLKRLTKDDLLIMRNEIYAVLGYKFKSDKMKAYFMNQKWYNPSRDNVDNDLNNNDIKNIKLIKKIEENWL